MADDLRREFYTLSDADTQRTYVGVRRAADWVGFFLPYLQPGISLLDCGCGVGSITLDLAERVAPGHVIGIDQDEGQLKIARANAAQRGLTNVSFEQGDVYALRFENQSFDAVLAHTLLYHLSDQVGALRELRRVLKPGGVAAVSDDDWSTIVYSPDHPLMRKAVDLATRVIQHNGGNPFYARHLRRLMLEAGFTKADGYAVAAEYYGNLQETRRLVVVMTGVFSSPDFRRVPNEQGWASQTEIDEMLAWARDWSERPDAFWAVMYCAAVGWNQNAE
jgi:ubiquinone/menaquinone biosynthesis C-methylase UbiE